MCTKDEGANVDPGEFVCLEVVDYRRSVSLRRRMAREQLTQLDEKRPVEKVRE